MKPNEGIQMRYWTAAAVLVAALVVGGVAGAFATARTGRTPFEAAHTVPVVMATGNNQAASEVSFLAGFSPVMKAVLPAVVNISSTKVIRSPDYAQGSPYFSDPFFRFFFGDEFSRQFNVPRERRERSLGSGVIVSPEGYLLTNNHVVEGADKIKVILADKRELDAKIVGTDPKTDVAVLRVDEKGLPVLPLADSTRVSVGDFALAIGNPFGIGQTVTMGIVSATGRGGLGIEDYEDFIQTDAAINPGNSGGALVNVRGQLIGINTAIIAPSGGNQGIGFAIPSNMARQVMEQILDHGKVIRGWLGVVIQPVTQSVARAFGLGEPRGALVGDVTPDSPAARGGLQRGDIIIELNGRPVTDSRDLRLRVAETAPGTTVRMKVFRNGSERELSVTLGEMPPEQGEARRGGGGKTPGALEGLSVTELTPNIARQLGLPRWTRGVVVDQVVPGSAAAEAGLRRGDVIQEVNRTPVASVAEFRRAVRRAGGGPVLLLVNRGGTTSYVVVGAD